MSGDCGSLGSGLEIFSCSALLLFHRRGGSRLAVFHGSERDADVSQVCL